jgi:hypothetical protein
MDTWFTLSQIIATLQRRIIPIVGTHGHLGSAASAPMKMMSGEMFSAFS